MDTLISQLVDNLPEIYKKECKGCMERKGVKAVCDFKSKECKKKMVKTNKWINEKLPKYTPIL